MIKANFKKHILKFTFDAGTSRGFLKEKKTWFIFIYDDAQPHLTGIGECGPLKGLSIDDTDYFESQLKYIIDHNLYYDLQHPYFQKFPSVLFAFETAYADLKNGGIKKIFINEFSDGRQSIPINGLIWMGNKDFMISQIKEKVEAGFSCLKLKVGSADFDTELEILSFVRKKFGREISIRLDANGAFDPKTCLDRLLQLEKFEIHSIEQPIKPGQTEEMARLCLLSPIPVALDEELIGIYGQKKHLLINQIKPQYIILKPTLLGGFSMCNEWIRIAENTQTGWWLTSALESNIGLNAIGQYAYEKIKDFQIKPLQGLGTGSLYHNNIGSPLQIQTSSLLYNPELKWDII